MFGTEEQKQQYLPPLARGEKLGAWGLTEASAGSDAAGMRTTARASGAMLGAERLEERSSPTAASASVMVVMAVTDRDARPSRHLRLHRRARHPGMSAGQEGEQARDARERHERSDLRATAACRPMQLLGDEGQGFINTLQVLDAGRIGIAALSVGLAQGAYEAAPRLRAGAPPVRPADRRVPGDPVEAGGQCHADRSGAAADLSRRVSEGRGRAHHAGVVDGEAVRQRDRRARPPTTACRSTAATAS